LVVLGWLSSLICWSGDLNSHQAFKGLISGDALRFAVRSSSACPPVEGRK
jgi:hypothetical protein